MKNRTIILLLCLSLLSSFAGCAPSSTEPRSNVYYTYFDTVCYVFSYAGDSEETFNTHSSEVSSLLETYHRLFDIYHEYAGINNLCTVNRLAGGEPVSVDRELIDFLLYAQDLYARTDGEMNIMLGSVLSIWHDYRTEALADPSAARLPTEAELSAAAAHTDFSLLEIDEYACTVRVTDPNASIDVGALGKGYAAERAAEHLEQQGVSGYVLNIGGNLRIVGTKPNGDGWVTGIRDPHSDDGTTLVNITLANTSCVTSGSYERFFTVDGQNYHHIIDPDTLWPADHFASVTVITKDSALADALSTALFCMSYEDGSVLIRKLDGVDAVWILADGTVLQTDGLALNKSNG